MKKYILFTDSACDLSKEMLAKWGVDYSSLSFRFTDDNIEYTDRTMSPEVFYNRMRDGGVAKTAAVNTEQFKTAFLELVKSGYDVLYIGFSSALSTTYNSARLAADEVMKTVSGSRVLLVDALCASLGVSLLINLVLEQKKLGAGIDEAYQYAENMKLKICHWFTVDDLVYLKRGGRVSAAAAFVGNALGIKPVLHVDNAGRLISVEKVRGRRNAIAALAEKYGEYSDPEYCDKVYISHADSEADVALLSDILSQKYGVTVNLVSSVGPVIGAHSGPGTIALFFVGKECRDLK